MFQAKGQLIAAYSSPASEKYPEAYRVQILGDMPMESGQVKKEMLTLGVPKSIYDVLQKCVGEWVTLPLGFYCKGGTLVTFFPKGGEVEI